MGKNKRSKLTFFDKFKNETIEIDSIEEYQTYCWIIEAKDLGIVKDYVYQPESFMLTEKFTYIPLYNNPKQKEKHLLADHVYTADFKILFDQKYGEQLSREFKLSNNCIKDGNIEVWIDVKGGFMRNDSGRSFSINQKLVYDKHKIFVQKFVPRDAFKTLGCPEVLFFTAKTKKPSKVFEGYKKISESIHL